MWGRGIATEALKAVTAEAFRRFDITRLYALPFADHAASVRVLEKAGYVREGHLPPERDQGRQDSRPIVVCSLSNPMKKATV